MQKQLLYITVALFLGVTAEHRLLAAPPPGQAYHRTPDCVDGNCVPNRPTSGYHATRWRPWPGGEPSSNDQIPPVGIELKKIDVPARDKELEMPVRPTAPGENASTEPSPNDKSSGTSLPSEFRDVTPKKPLEEALPSPGNSSLQRGPMFPGSKSSPSIGPLLIGKKPMPLRSLSPATPPNNIPGDDPPPMLKILPQGNPQSGLTPEMVPWNDADKNPIVRQAARISGNQVQQTLSLNEGMLPDSNDVRPLTIRVQHESSSSQPIQASANTPVSIEARPAAKSFVEPAVQETDWRAANAPAILPNVEARPLPAPAKAETASNGTAVASPLRGLSQGNPLRR